VADCTRSCTCDPDGNADVAVLPNVNTFYSRLYVMPKGPLTGCTYASCGEAAYGVFGFGWSREEPSSWAAQWAALLGMFGQTGNRDEWWDCPQQKRREHV
jgi:hypothetical protein